MLQFVDRMFLSWHSPESVAGAGTAGMFSICFLGFFSATTGFTSVFVSQYLGARRPSRLGPTIWQGWYLSILFGLLSLGISFFAAPIFNWLGHEPAVRQAEFDYFTAIMRGGVFTMTVTAIQGFFVGRGDNRVAMTMQLIGIAANTVLDYGMIFGRWGLPAWGVAGAAWATVLSQVIITVCGAVMFWRPNYRRHYNTWSGRKLELALCARILRFGSPNGLRSVVELVMWSVFLGLIGLLSAAELAVSNVAFTINSLAWQPMIGISMAVSMLVGKAQGANRPDRSRQAMRRGFIIAQSWETAAALLFVLFPDTFLRFFFGDLPPDALENYLLMGRMVLVFVAAYSLLDAMNVVFAMGLTGAGDSWWISKATIILSIAGAAMLFVAYCLDWGLYGYWFVATFYVAMSGAVWILRFKSKTWESMRVVETVVVEADAGDE
ncbi:MAG: MATE family efflux transporter [Planctomycetes bacterium]|nr:MATE family efflux transporter [Planctomycetota bacterium]